MTSRSPSPAASGYAGGEILRLLADHPTSRSAPSPRTRNAGQALISHPAAPAVARALRAPGHDSEVLAGHDVASSRCRTASRPSTPQPSGTPARHRRRSRSSAHLRRRLGGPSTAASTPSRGPTAFPNSRSPVASSATAARRRADRRSGGATPSTVALSLAPGVAAGVIDPGDIVSVLAVGPSGAGKSPKTNLLASEILGTGEPYAVGGTHRHIPRSGRLWRPRALRPTASDLVHRPCSCPWRAASWRPRPLRSARGSRMPRSGPAGRTRLRR